MFIRRILLFVLCCVGIFGANCFCFGVSTRASANTRPAESCVGGDEIVAKVGDRVLTKKDVDFIKKMFMPRVDAKRIIYLWTINAELADEARKEGLADSSEVRSVISFAQDEVLATLYVREHQKDVDVSDAEAKKYYEEHKKEFRLLPYVSVKMIAFDNREDAEKVKKALIEGANFDNLVKKYKKQTLKLTGLSDVCLKEISARDLAKPLGPPIAYTMANVKDFKQVIGPRRFAKGWLLFKVVGKKEAGYIPYEKIASRLKSQLRRRKLGEIRRKLIAQAEKKTGVKPPDSSRVNYKESVSGKRKKNVQSTKPAIKGKSEKAKGKK